MYLHIGMYLRKYLSTPELSYIEVSADVGTYLSLPRCPGGYSVILVSKSIKT